MGCAPGRLSRLRFCPLPSADAILLKSSEAALAAAEHCNLYVMGSPFQASRPAAAGCPLHSSSLQHAWRPPLSVQCWSAAYAVCCPAGGACMLHPHMLTLASLPACLLCRPPHRPWHSLPTHPTPHCWPSPWESTRLGWLVSAPAFATERHAQMHREAHHLHAVAACRLSSRPACLHARPPAACLLTG